MATDFLNRRVFVWILATLVLASPLWAQDGAKRPLEHRDYELWKQIEGEQLSPDGAWALYSLVPAHGDGDGALRVRSTTSATEHDIVRGADGEFGQASRFAVFQIRPRRAVLDSLELEGKDEDALPKDSLGILELATGDVSRFARVQSFQLPEEAAGWVAYLLEQDTTEADRPDAETEAEEEPAEEAQEGEEEEEGDEKPEGTTLVLRNLASGAEQRYEHVTDYAFSRDGVRLVYAASSEDGSADGVYVVEVETGEAAAILRGTGVYKGLALDEAGDQVAFLTSRDDWEADQPRFALYHWREERDSARVVAREGTPGITTGWVVSEHGAVDFSENGARLFFGTAPPPLSELDEDTLPPEDERVRVDIWNWKDPYLQPMQLEQAEDERERSYRAVVHLDEERRVVQLATAEVPEVQLGTNGDADVALGVSVLPYRQLISWDSPEYRDIYRIDVVTGERELIMEQTQARPELSPQASYAAWYDNRERAWFARDIESGGVVNLTASIDHPLYDELHDRPYPARAYGTAGWTEGDETLLVYDRYDIWAVDPTGEAPPRSITEGVGRAEELQFRVVDLDPEEEALDPSEPLLLSAFHFHAKSAGFYRERIVGDGRPERLAYGDYAFSRPTRAEDDARLLFTRQSFQEFPDLWISPPDFTDARRLSDANPWQSDFLWGTAELVEWRSSEGTPLQGILYKPENFDASRKYPMMVYFYERLSDNLNRYHLPVPGSSSINISFYVSRGYLVFVPDIPYEIGFPGESAMQAVVPGVLNLVAQGFVDEDAIGVQGHSWGGYQIAYMVTRTDLFAAAEAGAPVANMTSAYGGIRWGSGMSRMFQYERTQSRIGQTLWDGTLKFIENSPLFFAPKIETPLLMMHNDEDTAVPWEQGIELFVTMRRLGKPVWMINYNGAPHGLREDHNRRDWAIRMQQFFDHYLKGAPAPVWLAEGVPAVLKGRTLGLELMGEAERVAGDAAEQGSRH